MQKRSKQFGARDTDSWNSLFRESRLALTLLYVAILMVLLGIGNLLTWQAFATRLNTRFHVFQTYLTQRERATLLLPEPPLTSQDIRQDLLQIIMIVDGVLLVGAGALGYVLAGLTMRPIEEAYDKQRQLLSDVSHELRTPLAILRTSIENAQRDTSNNQSLLASNLEEVARMSTLVDDLLLLSRLDESREELHHVNLNETAKIAVERLRPLADKKSLALTLHLPDETLTTRAPSNDIVVRAITNIVNNAITYTPNHGSILVTLNAEKKHCAVLRVEDTGPGISSHDLPHIFDRFVRTDDSRSRHTGGSGLGLPIVQSIMMALRGKITIQSEEHKGTTAILTFPIHKAS